MRKKDDAGENIKVAVRVRPLFSKEIERGDHESVDVDLSTNQVIVKAEAGAPYMWTFDYVFNKSFMQKDIFIQVVHPMIESVMDGFNATIFAYGQSGSGKTHTMTGALGDPEQEGIIPRSFHHIFQQINESPAGTTWRLFCSFLELYNGKCRDLLVTQQTSLNIREAADKSFFVQDLSMPEIKMEAELFHMMEEGTDRRCVGVTDLNAHSSRSHSVFTVWLEKTQVSDEGGDCKVVTSKLNLVDLAGSERQSKTNASGDRLKEGANINLSLSALGTVIDSIVKGKGHIPFRSSPLTMLLKDSLGGGSKTAMFANCRPSNQDISETVSTLRFADRAKQIKNKPKVQLDPKDAKIAELTDEIEYLRGKLKKYEGDGGGDDDDEEGQDGIQDSLAQVEMDLEQERERASRLEQELSHAVATHKKTLADLQAKNEDWEERFDNLQQEKALADQQMANEKSQYYEVQCLIKEFAKDMSVSVPGMDADCIDANTVSKILAHVRDRPNNGPAPVQQQAFSKPSGFLAGPGAPLAPIAPATSTSVPPIPSSTPSGGGGGGGGGVAESEAMQRLTMLNEQAQTALGQAMARLSKMKEKIEKEKAKNKDQAEGHKKAIQEIEARHAQEVAKLKSSMSKRQSSSGKGDRDKEESIDDDHNIQLQKQLQEQQQAQQAQLQEQLQKQQQAFEEKEKALKEQMEARMAQAQSEDAEGKDQSEQNQEEVVRLEKEMETMRAAMNEEKQALARKMEFLKKEGEASMLAATSDPKKKKKPRKRSKSPKPPSRELPVGQESEEGLESAVRDVESPGQDVVGDVVEGGKGGVDAKVPKPDPQSQSQSQSQSDPKPDQAALDDKKGGDVQPPQGPTRSPNKVPKRQPKKRVRTSHKPVASIESEEELRRELHHVIEEAQTLANELEQSEQESFMLGQELDQALHKIKRNDYDHQNELHALNEEKKEIEQELDQLRQDLIQEVKKSSQLNADLIGMMRGVEPQHAPVATNPANDREVQRLAAELAQKSQTLENNKKVLQTQQELLEKKKKKEAKLAEEVVSLKQQLVSMESETQKQLQEQAAKLTVASNKRIEDLVLSHHSALKKEQKERDKISKKMMKEKMKLEKVRERYDQQMVIMRELENQVENLKENELKRFNMVDDIDHERDLINKIMAKDQISNRQQDIMSKAKQGLGIDNNPYKHLPHTSGDAAVENLGRGNKRQKELLGGQVNMDAYNNEPTGPKSLIDGNPNTNRMMSRLAAADAWSAGKG